MPRTPELVPEVTF